MKEIHEILVAPHVTEDTARNMVNPKSGARKYVFKVALDASKDDIKAAIEKRTASYAPRYHGNLYGFLT